MLVSASTVLHPQPPPRRCHWLLNIRRRNGYWEQLGEAPHSRFGPHNRQQTAFKFSRTNGILVSLVHLFKGNMWETTLFFSSFSFFLYLSKRAFQLDNFSIETSLLQLPENQTTHTQRSFQGKLGIPTFNTQDRDIINIIRPPIPWS